MDLHIYYLLVLVFSIIGVAVIILVLSKHGGREAKIFEKLYKERYERDKAKLEEEYRNKYKEIDDKYDNEVVEVAEKLKRKDNGIFEICKEYATTDMKRVEFIDKIQGQYPPRPKK